MRLLFITQDFPPETGGIQTYSFELGKRLARHADKFYVFAPKTKGSEKFDLKTALNIRRFKIPNALLFIKLFFKLPGFIRLNHPDIIFHAQWQTLPASVRAKKRGKIQTIAAAAHARELLYNPFGGGFLGRLYKRYQYSLLKYVDIWFPVSDYTGTLLEELGVKHDNIKVVINGTNPEQYYPKNSDDFRQMLGLEKKRIILTITRLVPRKGIDLVIKAMPEILAKIPDAYYLVVGSGDYGRELEKLVQELDLASFVHFEGRVDYDDLLNYYNSADVFVMPSKSEIPDVEGFGIVFLEANACGKPVIGSNSGGIPSAIKNEFNGLIVEENDVRGISEATIKILEDRPYAEELGKNGLRFVKEKANWDTVASKLYKYLEKQIHETT